MTTIDQLIAKAKRVPLPQPLDRFPQTTAMTDCLMERASILGKIYESRARFLTELSQALRPAQEQRRGLSRKSSRAISKIFYAWGNDDNDELNRNLSTICRLIAGDLILLENGDVVSPKERNAPDGGVDAFLRNIGESMDRAARELASVK